MQRLLRRRTFAFVDEDCVQDPRTDKRKSVQSGLYKVFPDYIEREVAAFLNIDISEDAGLRQKPNAEYRGAYER